MTKEIKRMDITDIFDGVLEENTTTDYIEPDTAIECESCNKEFKLNNVIGEY